MQNHANGLVRKQALTSIELTAIQQLVAVCDQYEHLHTRIEWSMLEKRGGQLINDFLYYRDGALVGYLALEEGAMDESETIALVHPDYRRRGIFRQLFNASAQECKARGMQRIIFVCEEHSHSGNACASTFKAQLELTEHEMFLGTFQPRNVLPNRLVVRKATLADVDTVAGIQEQGFERYGESVYHRVEQHLQDPTSHIYLTYVQETDAREMRAIGTFRLDILRQLAGIYGFVLLPAYQGHGYGRQMLEATIETIQTNFPSIDQHNIFLEVDVTNTRAFNLYRSCGFIVRTTYNYYALPLA